MFFLYDVASCWFQCVCVRLLTVLFSTAMPTSQHGSKQVNPKRTCRTEAQLLIKTLTSPESTSGAFIYSWSTQTHKTPAAATTEDVVMITSRYKFILYEFSCIWFLLVVNVMSHVSMTVSATTGNRKPLILTQHSSCLSMFICWV